MVDRVSQRQVERAMSSLRESKDVFCRTVYGVTKKGTNGVIGTIVTLTSVRAKIRNSKKSVPDILSAQLLYSPDESAYPTIEPPSGIAMFRHYTWINMDTGEEMLFSNPEFVRST